MTTQVLWERDLQESCVIKIINPIYQLVYGSVALPGPLIYPTEQQNIARERADNCLEILVNLQTKCIQLR